MFDIRKGEIIESEFGKFQTREQAEKELGKRVRRNNARKQRDDLLRSCGLTKVRGALGGIYWE